MAWLRLTATPGASVAAVRRLLSAFGLPQAVLAQDVASLCTVVEPAVARRLAAPPDAAMAALIDRTLAWLAQSGHAMVTLADAAYPARLLDLADPPPVLYVNGNPAMLSRPGLGIVGARNATAQGTRDANTFASAFSAAGLSVVSGLALGIDAAAHAGALAGPGGTVAVIGTGADIVYPARHHALAHQIVDAGGAIVSEFPLGTPGLPNHFPRRNRLIAALARGVLVVEAAERSGSLITARLASEIGREVFAIPGSIHAELSRGCHKLIRQGAKLVESATDVFEEFADLAPSLAPVAAKPARSRDRARRGEPSGGACKPVADASRTPRNDGQATGPLAIPSDALGAALAYDPVTFDALCERSGLTAEAASATLLQLELAGAAERLPGNRYRRLA
ncbi:DNA protecting protein DprA [Cupriavidus sp. YR651]|uniref:DNA-processing protein DprA n=1 Tax=Cupriavidus sp. YR651 TaxID=1855315 RepID=UPI00087E866B|nr:DNA-processing protein DprA [Cupriavidus sp. YR651]SDD13317.1 DNA protecting protein DprA [Cupriavidus sp. YR651]